MIPYTIEVKVNSKKIQTTILFPIYGFFIGLCFPLFSCVFYCVYSEEESISLKNLSKLHLENPLQQVIDLAPIVLGFTGYVIGKKQRDLEERQEKLQELYQVTQKFYPVEFLQLLNKTDFNIQLGESLKIHGNILFTDIRDFTSISENLSPLEVIQFINKYMECILPLATKYGGIIDKFIGDSIMILFPFGSDDALDFVIDTYKNIQAINQSEEVKYKIRNGYGLHFGEIALGTIGSKTRMQTTVLGDAVNTTARIESLSSKLGTTVLMSSDFLRNLSKKYNYRFVGNFLLKGKSERIGIYELLDLDDPDLKEKKMSYAKDLATYLAKIYNEDSLIQIREPLQEFLKICPEDTVVQFYLSKIDKLLST